MQRKATSFYHLKSENSNFFLLMDLLRCDGKRKKSDFCTKFIWMARISGKVSNNPELLFFFFFYSTRSDFLYFACIVSY